MFYYKEKYRLRRIVTNIWILNLNLLGIVEVYSLITIFFLEDQRDNDTHAQRSIITSDKTCLILDTLEQKNSLSESLLLDWRVSVNSKIRNGEETF